MPSATWRSQARATSAGRGRGSVAGPRPGCRGRLRRQQARAAGTGPWRAGRPARRRTPLRAGPVRAWSWHHDGSTRPQRQGFGRMGERHLRHAGEGGHRPGDPGHLVQPAGAQGARTELCGEECSRLRGQLRFARARVVAGHERRRRGGRPRPSTPPADRPAARRDPGGSAARRGRSGRAAVPRCGAGTERGRRRLQLQAPRYTPSPHGQGFMAATRRKAAGKVTVPPARLTRITPSSSGWRSASRAATGNSPSSSRNRMPCVARLTSPGRSGPAAPRPPGRRWRPGGAGPGTAGGRAGRRRAGRSRPPNGCGSP